MLLPLIVTDLYVMLQIKDDIFQFKGLVISSVGKTLTLLCFTAILKHLMHSVVLLINTNGSND
jgi:hypothetical protein